MSLFPNPEPIPDGHTFAEHRPFHAADMLLRRAGFRIHARPARGEAVWERGGELYSESAARRVVEAALARKEGT